MESPRTNTESSPVHAMTCDVEDYFQVSAFSDHVERTDWESKECHIPANVERILERFAEHDAKGTFFILGWVAQHYPEVVRMIVAGGHEVASHGMQHTRVWHQTREQFREDAVTARKLLEDVSGVPVIGYRAASWSIDGRTPWAHDVLAEAGYQYSSSIYPIRHDHFGMPEAQTLPYRIGEHGLLEVPASVVRIFGQNIPASGGGYFRLYPLRVSLWLIDRISAAEEAPFVFYFHPWELDPDQPRITGAPVRARFRHYLNLRKFEARLTVLLQRYRWGRMDEIYLNGVGA